MSTRIRLDLRGMEPPEPLRHVLDALERLGDGELCITLDREPLPLYRILDRNGYVHDVLRRPDGDLDILIRAIQCGGR